MGVRSICGVPAPIDTWGATDGQSDHRRSLRMDAPAILHRAGFGATSAIQIVVNRPPERASHQDRAGNCGVGRRRPDQHRTASFYRLRREFVGRRSLYQIQSCHCSCLSPGNDTLRLKGPAGSTVVDQARLGFISMPKMVQ
jgi:hypothetical protein